MQQLKRFAEWYLGVPPADPGQGTAWNFQNQSPWPVWMPDWTILLLVVAVLGYLVWVYLRDTHSVPLVSRSLMMIFRLSALGLALLFLTELTLSVDRTGLPFIAIMIDDSASMNLEDQYSDDQSAAKVEQLLEAQDDATATRINLAKAILTQHDGAFLKELQRKYKLRVYRFSETAVPLGRGEYISHEEVDELIPVIRALEAEGDQTRPGPAVRKVLNDLRGTPPSAIILLTDGIASTTDADRLSEAADAALNRLVPLFPIGLGSEEPARDLQLYDMLVDEVAFVGDPINFSAKLKGYGFAGETATIQLKEQGRNDILAETEIRVASDGQPVKFELVHTPSEEGDYEFALEVLPLENETNVDNNAESRQVSVRQEKIRVLLADSLPRYEFRYLKHLLERDHTIELHTVLQDADLEYSAEDETALDHFPVRREDLMRYDVIIFGDLNPTYLSAGIFENLRDFVREAGGGLIMVAGTQHNPLSYRGTSLENMLPIDLASATSPSADLPITEGFRPRLTLEGRKGNSIFRFAESEEASLTIWNQLPELYWMIRAPDLKPGAVVYAEHRTRNGNNGRLPVIALQRFGAGKVLFHATDDLWRWRFRVGDLYYGRYWVQGIRFLSRSKLLGRDRTAELTVDRLVYQRGDPVNFRVRFLDDRLVPAQKDGVTVMVEQRGGAQQTVKLTQLSHAPSVFEGQLPRAAEGSYHAWIVTPAFSEAPPSADFRVEAPVRELRVRSMDRTDLSQAAKATRGRYYSVADSAQLLDDLPPGHPVPLETQDPILLWNRWELLLLFASFLTGEWLLRKRHRLI